MTEQSAKFVSPVRIRLERRLTSPAWVPWVTPVISIVLALLVGAVIIGLQGVNPLLAYKAMFSGAFGSGFGLSETFVKMTPLLLAGLGVSLAFRMQMWNIGAEGQLWMGAWAAAGVGLFLHTAWNLPPWLTIILMALAGMIGGGLWGAIPGALKAYLNVNEIITSLLLTFVAISWVEYFVDILWRDPGGLGFPNTAPLEKAIWLPKVPFLFFLPASHRVHLGLVFGIVAAIVLWFILSRMRWGYEIRAIGENQVAAAHAGMPVARNIFLVMVLSGALAGLAGMAEMAGVAHRLQRGLSPGYGFTAIIIAWLAKLNPFAVILVAFLFGGLLVGGDQIQITMGLPAAVSEIIQGLVLFFVLAGDTLSQFRIRFR